MSSLNMDYSYWKYFKVWTVRDAWNIIKHYNLELLADDDDQSRLRQIRKYHNLFERDSWVFAYDTCMVHEMEDGVPQMDQYDEFIIIPGDDSKVEINEFIKWAYSVRIPLPPEIMDIAKHNWENGDLKPNSEMSANDYRALSELPELKNKIIRLQEDNKLLKYSIRAATKAFVIFYNDVCNGNPSKSEFIDEIKKHFDFVPDEISEMIFDQMPHLVEQEEQVND